MKRTLLSVLAALLVLGLVPAAAQSPVASPAATADPFALPGNHLIVRIRAGNGFDYARLDDGTLAYRNQHLIDDGASTGPVPDWLGTWYTSIGVIDVHTSQAVMMPEGGAGPIGIEIRLLSFPDEATAAAAIPASFGSLLRQEGEVPRGALVVEMDPAISAHDPSVIEVTGLDASPNGASDSQEPASVPFTRLIAQRGAMVTTVKVTSADPAVNEAIARDLLAAQLGCLAAGNACVPVALPAGVEFPPGTPVASPVAMVHRGSSVL